MPSSVTESTIKDGTSNQVDEDEDEWLVFCRCEKAKSVYTLLSCLRNIGVWVNRVTENRDLSMTQSRRSSVTANRAASIQPVTVFCYPKNMTFHVIGKSKQIQASVSMQAGLFSQYKILQSSSEDNEEEKTEDWHSEGEVRFGSGTSCRVRLFEYDESQHVHFF